MVFSMAVSWSVERAIGHDELGGLERGRVVLVGELGLGQVAQGLAGAVLAAGGEVAGAVGGERRLVAVAGPARGSPPIPQAPAAAHSRGVGRQFMASWKATKVSGGRSSLHLVELVAGRGGAGLAGAAARKSTGPSWRRPRR